MNYDGNPPLLAVLVVVLYIVFGVHVDGGTRRHTLQEGSCVLSVFRDANCHDGVDHQSGEYVVLRGLVVEFNPHSNHGFFEGGGAGITVESILYSSKPT